MTVIDLHSAECRPGERSETLTANLQNAAAVLNSQDSSHLNELLALRRRFREERLQLAVLGQFKRGKSTFINALLGAPVLPAAVVPLTAIATFIAWRADPLIRVRYRHGKASEQFTVRDADAARDILFRFVTEEANPNNRLEVERVELFYPAQILTEGTVLIDTPGIGSTLSHNTKTAIDLLPECDAAIFVVSADPPITQAEREYLERVKQHTRQVFFVLNKIDYLAPDEQQDAIDFLNRFLMESSLGDASTQIFCTSAKRGIDAKLSGNRDALVASGMAQIEEYLVRSLARDKARLLEEAIRKRAAEILSDARAQANLRLRALQLPLDDLALKLSLFDEKLRAIEEQRRRLGDFLIGDRRRLRVRLEELIETLRKDAMTKLAAVVDKSVSGASYGAWECAVQEELSREICALFESSRTQIVQAFSSDANAALLVHLKRIDSLADAVRQSASGIFAVPFEAARTDNTFQLAHEPYWVSEEAGTTLIPDPRRWIDRILPLKLTLVRRRARVLHLAHELVLRNAENLRWAMLRGLDETWRLTATQFEERIDRAIAATKGVIDEALARRKSHSFTVASEADKLERSIQSLTAMKERILGISDEKIASDDTE